MYMQEKLVSDITPTQARILSLSEALMSGARYAMQLCSIQFMVQ